MKSGDVSVMTTTERGDTIKSMVTSLALIHITGFKAPMLSQHLLLPTHVLYPSLAKNI